MADTSKYWALVDLRYPAGDAEYAKAMKGEEYQEVSVKAGGPLVSAPEKSIKALLSMGRKVITTQAPPASETQPRKKSGLHDVGSKPAEPIDEETPKVVKA